jgi:hypothetical protein
MGRAVFAALLLALLTACSDGGRVDDAAREPAATPSTSASPSGSASAAPEVELSEPPSRSGRSRSGPRLDTWELGSRTLPLRPDGFGQVRRTPEQLRIRRMPTVTNLPDPEGERFTASVRRITPWVRGRMGSSWERGCPVGLRDLRYLQVTFWGFDERPHRGELIVHEDHARGVVGVFRKLYGARFPIEQMTLPTSTKRDPTPSGDGNGTGAMVCRATTGQTFWSAHALGLAIDLNPFQNPYKRGDLVIPERASAYLDRSWQRPGMIRRGGLVVRAFREIGWSWGGSWTSLKDYQHFSANGR